MGLIKAAASAPIATVRLSLRDIEAEARAMVAEARQQADQVLQEAQRQAEQLIEEARQRGYRQGHADGFQSARREMIEQHTQEIRQAIDALAGAAAIIESSRAELEKVALADVVRLALAVAARITRRQGLVDPGVLAENLREAVKLIIHRDKVRVAIHPSQRATLADAIAQLKLEWPAMQHVEIEEDQSLIPGGCRVTSGQGEVNADLNVQLDRIAAKLIPGASACDAAETGISGAGGPT